MKWIAVPTDFTVTSANAVTYAAELAYFLGAKLLVFHVADRPNFTPTFGEDAEKPDEVEQESMAMLKTIANKLTDRFKGRLDFETALQWGREEETAQRLIDELSPDLLVIGIRNDNFLTSTWDDHGMAYELDCNRPVLTVRQNNAFVTLRKMVILSDTFDRLSDSAIDIISSLQERGGIEFDILQTHKNAGFLSAVKAQLAVVNTEIRYRIQSYQLPSLRSDLSDVHSLYPSDMIMVDTTRRSAHFWSRLIHPKGPKHQTTFCGPVPVITLRS